MRRPKSVVYVAPRFELSGTPVTIPSPMSEKSLLRMFARCGGLFIHASTMFAGDARKDSPQAMFSPIVQPPGWSR